MFGQLRSASAVLILIAAGVACSNSDDPSGGTAEPASFVTSATVPDLQRAFDGYTKATFKVRYRVRFSAHISDTPKDLGFITHEKETTTRERFEASGDVARLGMGDVIVLVDGDSVYFCSSRLKLSEKSAEPGCYSGGTAAESAAIFVSGVGLTLDLTHVPGASTFTLGRAWDTSVAGIRGTCYEYGSAKLPSLPLLQACFAHDGVLLSRRFTDGETVTAIEAVDVALPVTDDFAIPYPLK